MNEWCPPTNMWTIDPEPLYQQANMLWGYAVGLITVVPIAALWRWLRV